MYHHPDRSSALEHWIQAKLFLNLNDEQTIVQINCKYMLARS